MTLRLLEKEALGLPSRSKVRLVEKIMASIGNHTTPEMEAAWDLEIDRRVAEIKSEAEAGLRAKVVFKKARRALKPARF